MSSVKKAVAKLVTGSSIEEEEVKTGLMANASRMLMYFAFLLMGLGNWSDSKELLTEGYQGFITHFTDRIEKEKLASLRVGNYLPHVEASIGIPIVVKASSINVGLEYRYYKTDKFLLTLINEQNRISGVVVHSLASDSKVLDRFAPQVPFSEYFIVKDSIASISKVSNDYYFDSNNLIYFMTSRNLGSAGMQLNQASGVTEYDGHQSGLKLKLDKLDEALMMDKLEQAKPLAAELTSQRANFYAIYEVKTQIIADSLLTRYEFNAYFKG
ncbi:ETEC_3214 domain-containing protein [Shewanella goraebulensis]|uniref:ETEC_3214 domain-containing protein n=1 Tax=Shewanella goraebulensis TaxID=3050637 RepID=UPI002549DCB1|nr:ETEC_3214 domain-containing protein [Shewanella goraebulensis]